MLARTATTPGMAAPRGQERRRGLCWSQQQERRRRCVRARATPADADAGADAASVAAATTTTTTATTTTPPAAPHRPIPATSLPSALRGPSATPQPPQLLLLPPPTPYRRRVPPARATLRALLDGLEDADADALSFGPLLGAADELEEGGRYEDDEDDDHNGETEHADNNDDDERWLRLLAGERGRSAASSSSSSSSPAPTTSTTGPDLTTSSSSNNAAAARAAAHLARLHPQLLRDPETLLRWRRFLEAFDLPPRTRARLLAAAPELVTRGCVHSTGRLLLFYRAWGWSDESLRSRIFAQWPRLLLSRVEEECHPVVEYARALGATDEGVATLLWEYPRITRPRGVTVGGGTGGLGGWAGWAGGGAGGDYRAQLRKFARLGMYGLRSPAAGVPSEAAAMMMGQAGGEEDDVYATHQEEEEEEEDDGGGGGGGLAGSGIVSSR